VGVAGGHAVKRVAREALAIAAALLCTTIPAAGQEAAQPGAELRDRGCCLDEVNDGAKVEKLKIRGNEALDSGTIENAIYTTESGSLPWSEDHELIKSEFVKDLQRIYVLYQRHGYFDAELESYDIQPDGEDGVAITLQVSEGEPARVDSLSLEGLETIDGEELRNELRDRIPLKEDEIFNEADLVASRDLLENEFKNRGYAFAQVLLEYRIRKEEHQAAVTYTVAPGEVYYLGEVEVHGAENADDVELIRDQLAFERGQRFDRQKVLDTQRRIYELALFRRVDTEPQLASLRGDTVDVIVTVVPAPTHLVRVGVGYGTEDLVRVSGSWLDRNLFGRGRQLEVRGLYSRLEREAAVTYRQPTLVVPNLNAVVTAFLRYEDEETFTVQRIGATARVGYRVSRYVQTNAGITGERAFFSQFNRGVLIPELGRDFVNPSRLLYTDLGATFDNTDSLFMPTRGFRASFDNQVGLPFVSFDYGYNKLTLLVTHYRELVEGWVLAGKILPGVIYTYGSGDRGRVPLYQRLFAGGANSVRGYERRRLGPKVDPEEFGVEGDPEPIGGNGLFETSLELRFPIRGNFRGAAFIDAGNVWDSAGEISLADLEYTPGAGLRYLTAIGPIRLDVGRRMSSGEPFLPKWVFHISIGNAF
jgi:outer membrane protein insertion porin family